MSTLAAELKGRRLPARPVLTERQLVRAVTRGDERAFAQLYRAHATHLYRYCAAILGSSEDASDALQNAMTKAFSAMRHGTEPDNIKAWLYRIAHNEAIELIRRRRDLEPLSEAEAVPDLSVRGAEPRAELRQLVRDLQELPARHRAALVMRELGDLSTVEIAAALEASPGAVKQLIYEARRGLHEMADAREMDCGVVRRALSDGDGRRLRSRGMRAHLGACPACTAFKHAIGVRRAELHALPVLPLIATGGLLSSILGSANGAGSAGGGLGGGGLLGGASGIGGISAAKVAALSVITAAVGFTGIRAGDAVTGGGRSAAEGAVTSGPDAAPHPSTARGSEASKGATHGPRAGREDRTNPRARSREAPTAALRDARASAPGTSSSASTASPQTTSTANQTGDTTVHPPAPDSQTDEPSPPATIPVDPDGTPRAPVPDSPPVPSHVALPPPSESSDVGFDAATGGRPGLPRPR